MAKKEIAAEKKENTKKEKKQPDITIEEAFLKLDETIARLESEDISLEESFQIYKNGMELLKKCNQSIDMVEKRVLVLNEDGETNEF